MWNFEAMCWLYFGYFFVFFASFTVFFSQSIEYKVLKNQRTKELSNQETTKGANEWLLVANRGSFLFGFLFSFLVLFCYWIFCLFFFIKSFFSYFMFTPCCAAYLRRLCLTPFKSIVHISNQDSYTWQPM